MSHHHCVSTTRARLDPRGRYRVMARCAANNDAFAFFIHVPGFSFGSPSSARSAMATVAWTARVGAPVPPRRRDLRARASPSRVCGEGDSRRRASDDGCGDATAPMVTRRDACVALALAASSAVAGPARADTAAISRAYDGYAATYDDLDGGAFAADTLGLDATRRAAREAREDMLNSGWARADPRLRRGARDDPDGGGHLGGHVSAGEKTRADAFVVKRALRDSDAEALVSDDVRLRGGHVSLCVFSTSRGALAEVARVLKPDGTALLVEHTRSATVPLLGSYQDLVAGPVQKMSKGCAWNQDVVAMATRAGLRVVSAEPILFGTLTTLEARKA